METRRVNFRLPDKLVEKADVAAEISHKDRTEIVTEALRQYLDEMESEEAFREQLVELYLDGELSHEVLVTFLGRQDAESVRTSKAILDRGEELAEDMADL